MQACFTLSGNSHTTSTGFLLRPAALASAPEVLNLLLIDFSLTVSYFRKRNASLLRLYPLFPPADSSMPIVWSAQRLTLRGIVRLVGPPLLFSCLLVCLLDQATLCEASSLSSFRLNLRARVPHMFCACTLSGQTGRF